MFFHNAESLCLMRGAFVQLLVASMRRDRYHYDPMVLKVEREDTLAPDYYDLSTVSTVDANLTEEGSTTFSTPLLCSLSGNEGFRYQFTTTLLDNHRLTDYRGVVTWGAYGPKSCKFTTRKARPWVVVGALSNDRLLVIPLTTNQSPHTSQRSLALGCFYSPRPSTALISQLQTIDEWELNVTSQRRLGGNGFCNLVEEVADFLTQ